MYYNQTERNSNGFHNEQFDLSLNILLVEFYDHAPNDFLLMACTSDHIVLFKREFARIDRWQLGSILRNHSTTFEHDWHDGPIVSMGCVDCNTIYLFTEREFFLYNHVKREKCDTRILPQGGENGIDFNNHPCGNNQRRCSTIHCEYIYHIYMKPSSNWTMYKMLLKSRAHVNNYNLTKLMPSVQRFIDIHVNIETINFLVECDDGSFTVIFSSLANCEPCHSLPPIILKNAQHPLTITSVYINKFQTYIFFVNDPSANILHIFDKSHYIHSYQICAHAMSYVADEYQLLIATNRTIVAMDFNQL
jgi:hypothetical protein